MSGLRRIALSSIQVTAVNYAIYFVNIFVQAIIARYLLPGDYGAFALAVSVIEIMFVMLALDFSTAAMQLGGKDGVYENAAALCLLNIVALLVVGAFCVLVLQARFDRAVVEIFCVVFCFRLLNLVSKVFLTFLEKDFLFLRSGLIRGAVRLCSLGAGLGMALYGFGVYSLVAIDVINCLALFVLSIIYSPLRLKLSGIDLGILKATFLQSLKLLNYRISNILFYRLPNILIGALTHDKTAIGILDRSLYWAGLPTTVTAAFHSQILFVVFARNQEKKNVLLESLNWGLWILARLTICFSLVIYFYPESFVMLMLGKNWLSIAPVLKALSLYSFFVLLYNIMIQVFVGLKREGVLTGIQHIANIALVTAIGIIAYFHLTWDILAMVFSLLTLLMFLALALLVRRSEIKVRFWFIFKTPLIITVLSAGLIEFFNIGNMFLGATLTAGSFLVVFACLDGGDFMRMTRMLRAR